jgi:hypothetical protein
VTADCSLVFTASLKGTIIRVFAVSDGSRLYKVRLSSPFDDFDN